MTYKSRKQYLKETIDALKKCFIKSELKDDTREKMCESCPYFHKSDKLGRDITCQDLLLYDARTFLQDLYSRMDEPDEKPLMREHVINLNLYFDGVRYEPPECTESGEEPGELPRESL